MEGCKKPKDLLKRSDAAGKKSPKKSPVRWLPRKGSKDRQPDSSDDEEEDESVSEDSNEVKPSPKKVKDICKKEKNKEKVSGNRPLFLCAITFSNTCLSCLGTIDAAD